MPDARVFVSYSHEDTPEIEDDIRRLQSHGYAVFHDRQIVPGTDWRERIANDLVNSALVLFYSSKHSNRSKHCLAEMSFALDLEKPTVVVKIDHIDLAPGLRMYLGAQQTINRYEDSLAAYSSKLLTAVQQKVDSEKDKIARLAGTRTALSLSRVSNTSKIERIDSLFEAALDFMAVDNKGIDIVGADDGTLLDRTGTFLISIDVAQAAETQLHIRVSAIMDSSEFEREFSCERFPVPLVSGFYESLSTILGEANSIEVDRPRDSILFADTQHFGAMTSFLNGMVCGLGQNYEAYGALRHYEQAIKLDPDFVMALRNAANDAFNLGDRKKARELYSQAIKRHDRLPLNQQHVTRAWYYMQFGDFRRSATEWKAYIPSSPGDRNMMLGNAALALLYARDPAEALSTARSAVNANDDYFTQANLAMYLMYSGDFKRCEEKLLEIGVKGSTYQAATTMGICQTMLGRKEEALRIYESLLLGNEYQRAVGLLGLADIYAQSESYQEAASLLSDAELDEQNPLQPIIGGYAGIYAGISGAELAPSVTARLLAGIMGMDFDKRTLYLLGRAAVLLKDSETSDRIASSLSSTFEIDGRVYSALLKAEGRLVEGDFAAVVDLVSTANNSLDTWQGHFLSAQAFLGAGATLNAYIELETCVARRGEAVAIMLDEIPTTHLLASAERYFQRVKDNV